MSSDPINIKDMPKLPNIGYFNKEGDTNSINSYSKIETNLTKNCVNANWKNVSGIYKDSTTAKLSDSVSIEIDALDIPYYKLIYPDIVTGVENNTTTNLTNQINYLTCQLQETRNRIYNKSDFVITAGSSVKDIFSKATKATKYLLIVLFVLSMYFALTGFCGSFDVVGNIFNVIEKKGKQTISFWIGILIGIIIPFIILISLYSTIICQNLSSIKKYDITSNPYGEKINIESNIKNFNYLTLILFIFIIYAFIAVLFTIKKSMLGPYIYTAIISIILFIISIFLYMLYAFVPFFNEPQQDKKIKTENMIRTKPKPLVLFIDNQTDISKITTNQDEDAKLKKVFNWTILSIFILTLGFFMIKTNNEFITGVLASSAILMLPIMWVFNFIIIIQYFYVYPIILIFIRFFRYIIMGVLYVISEKKPDMKNSFSQELIDKLNNFKNFSPSWGLLIVDELKLLLQCMGYENIFSKSIIPENNNSKNITDNKFVASGTILWFLFQKITNKETNVTTGLIYGIILLAMSIIISMIILFGILKI
jgi:hypothetical protein